MIETHYPRAHAIDKWREIVRPIRSKPQTAENSKQAGGTDEGMTPKIVSSGFIA